MKLAIVTSTSGQYGLPWRGSLVAIARDDLCPLSSMHWCPNAGVGTPVVMGGAEIKTALAMAITKVEASMLVMWAVMVGVGMMSVAGPVKRLLVELMMVTGVITRVKLVE